MSKARIILRDEAYEKAVKIQETTGKATLTEVVNDLIHRYGQHYVDTWVLPSPVVTQLPLPAQSPLLQFDETERAFNLDTEITGI